MRRRVNLHAAEHKPADEKIEPSLRTMRPMAIAASTLPPSLLRHTTEAWRFADTTANVRSSPADRPEFR